MMLRDSHVFRDQDPNIKPTNSSVNGLQLSQSGALAAWSIHDDGVLLSTDLATFENKERK
jgi:hypothetical protein